MKPKTKFWEEPEPDIRFKKNKREMLKEDIK